MYTHKLSKPCICNHVVPFRLPLSETVENHVKFHRSPWTVDGFRTPELLALLSHGQQRRREHPYRAALQAIELEQQQPHLKIAGVILNQPYFGGIERTESEMRSETDPILPLRANDYMWELALPRGAHRDHEFCNAILASEGDGRVASLLACMVRVHGGDPLADRQWAMAGMLEGRGVHVIRRFHEGGFHGVELFDPEKADAFLSDVRDFVSSVIGHPLPPCAMKSRPLSNQPMNKTPIIIQPTNE